MAEEKKSLIFKMEGIALEPSQWIEVDGFSLLEGHPVIPEIRTRLLVIPVVPRHRDTVATAAYPGRIA